MSEENTPENKPSETPAIKPEDFKALQSSVEALEAKNRELLKEKSDAKKAAETAAAEAAKKSGDVEALEKSWQQKLNDAVTEKDGKLSEYQKMIDRMTVGTQAQKLAAELALPGSADALLPHIESRLQVEIKDGQPDIRVLGKDGKPSAASLDDLRKEIEENKAFAPLLVGSKASGSGDVSANGKPASGKTITRIQFDAMNALDRAAHFKSGGKIVD